MHYTVGQLFTDTSGNYHKENNAKSHASLTSNAVGQKCTTACPGSTLSTERWGWSLVGLCFFLRNLGENLLPRTLHVGMRLFFPCWPPAGHKQLLIGLSLVLAPDPTSQNQQQSIRLFMSLEFSQLFCLPRLLQFFSFCAQIIVTQIIQNTPVISKSLTTIIQAKSTSLQSQRHAYPWRLYSAQTISLVLKDLPALCF